MSSKADNRRPHLVFVLGTTATGKSDCAVEIAELVKSLKPDKPISEIICCDSIQFFQGVDVGAAKPTPEQMLRVPHHLVGHLKLGAVYTAGEFRKDALSVIEARAKSGVQDFLAVGGSGFYVQALEKGMFEAPKGDREVRERLESELAERGGTALHNELLSRDPVAGAKIHPADHYRLLRALEILRMQTDGQTLSSLREKFEAEKMPPPFRVSKIGLFRERQILRKRVTERSQFMIENGLIEETEALRTKGFGDWAPLKSVGYKEAQEFLEGKLSRSELLEAIVTSTMQLAKRQTTWFKKDLGIKWFDSELGFQKPKDYALDCYALNDDTPLQ